MQFITDRKFTRIAQENDISKPFQTLAASSKSGEAKTLLNLFNLGHPVRLSEYVYRQNKNNTVLCYPDGFQWRRNVTVSMVITGKSGFWAEEFSA